MRLGHGAELPPLPEKLDDKVLALCEEVFELLRAEGGSWTLDEVTRWLAHELRNV